jgi:hypothetical protein
MKWQDAAPWLLAALAVGTALWVLTGPHASPNDNDGQPLRANVVPAPAPVGPTPNAPAMQQQFLLDTAPTPLSWDAGGGPAGDAGFINDGGDAASLAAKWTPPNPNQYVKTLLLEGCTGSVGTVCVDLIGVNGNPGQQDVCLTLACGVLHPVFVAAIYPTNISDGGITVVPGY